MAERTADEVAAVFAAAGDSVTVINGNKADGQKNMALDYTGLLAHAIKAITELKAEVATLKTKVAALEAA